MQKCKFCFSLSEEGENVCPVCGIEKTKSKEDLTKQEKRKRYFCKAIRVVGFLQMIVGILLIFGGILLLITSISSQQFIESKIISLIFIIFYGIFSFILGFYLTKYKRWIFYAALIFYSIQILLNIIVKNPYRVVITILFLYYIANPTSREIFLRKNLTLTITDNEK